MENIYPYFASIKIHFVLLYLHFTVTKCRFMMKFSRKFR